MAINLVTIAVTGLYFANAVGQLFYGNKLRKKYPGQHNYHDTILSSIIWIVAGIFFPFYYPIDNINIRIFQNLSTFFVCIFTPFVLFLILYYQKRKTKKDPSVRERRTIEIFIAAYNKKNIDKEHTYKTDISRKALHLFPIFMILMLWIFAVYMWEGMWNQHIPWGISGENFGRFLILTVGFGGILVFTMMDYVRLSHIYNKNIFHLLPDIVSNLLGNAMKRSELYEFTKPAALVLAFATVFFAPFPVFCAAALIATIGDGAASIFGLGLGRIHFPKGSPKTIIGYVSGTLASFGVCMASFMIFAPGLLMTKIIIISLSGALVFFVIDLLNLDLDDNMLNPIFSAIVMSLLYILI